jgi:hypothetical protein
LFLSKKSPPLLKDAGLRQEMQNKGSVKGTSGASGYAPGHATTGSSKTRNRDHNDKTKSRY